MRRRSFRVLAGEEAEAAAPAKDVLLAVSGALSGDRKRIRLVVGKAQDRIEKRALRELHALRRSQSSSGKKKAEIRGARLPPPEPLPPITPPGIVEMRLPDGRKRRLMLAPAAARHRDLAVLGRISGANTKRAFEAITHNGRAIDRLAASQRDLADRLARLQSRGDRALLQGIVEGLANLENRIEGAERRQNKALVAQERTVREQLRRQARALTAETRAAGIQKLHAAVTSAQTAAFGTQGSLLATNNLLLVANQLGWGFITEFLEALGLAKPGTTSPLEWLAPLASLLTSQAVLGRRQHERFVSGIVSDFTVYPGPYSYGYGGGVATISLRHRIAPAEWETFARRTDIPVTTVLLEPRPSDAPYRQISSSGEVRDGTLTVRIESYSSLPTEVVVAWTIDTRRRDG